MTKTTIKEPQQVITRKQLEKKLMSIVGATPATIVAETDYKMNKTNNPYYGEVTKITTANVFINFNYQNSVNKARIKEGNEEVFEAHSRKWGERITGTPLIMHKGVFYLEARLLSTDKTRSALFHLGQPINKALLSPYVTEKKSSAEHQGVSEENVIVMRDYKVENIREIRFGGNIYIVKD
jgi:hypothetical protein